MDGARDDEVWCLRVGWSRKGGNDYVRAEWDDASVPDELVCDVLADFGSRIGVPVSGILRRNADGEHRYVEVYIIPYSQEADFQLASWSIGLLDSS